MSKSDDAPVLYTREEVAKILKVSLSTVGREIRAGRIYSFRVGRGLRVPAAALQRYAEQKAYLSSDKVEDMPDFATYPPTPSLLEGAENGD